MDCVIDKSPPGLHMCSRSLLVSLQVWSWFWPDPQTCSVPEEPWPPAGSLSVPQTWLWPLSPSDTQSCSGPCSWHTIHTVSTPSCSWLLPGIHVWSGGKWPTRSLPEFHIWSWVWSPPVAKGFLLSFLMLQFLPWGRCCFLLVSGPWVHTFFALSLGESRGVGGAIDPGSVPLESPPDDFTEQLLVGWSTASVARSLNLFQGKFIHYFYYCFKVMRWLLEVSHLNSLSAAHQVFLTFFCRKVFSSLEARGIEAHHSAGQK